jgi:hypothetical protein
MLHLDGYGVYQDLRAPLFDYFWQTERVCLLLRLCSFLRREKYHFHIPL